MSIVNRSRSPGVTLHVFLILILSATFLNVHPKLFSRSCANPTAAKAIIQSNVGTAGTISGTVKLYATQGGKTTIHIKVTGLPPGPHPYHIHVGSVGGAGGKPNCNAAGGLFNPNRLPDTAKCNPARLKQTCQIGDLASIFGPVQGGAITDIRVVHPSLELIQAIGKSIVFHNPDAQLTRIACGDIRAMDVVNGRERNC